MPKSLTIGTRDIRRVRNPIAVAPKAMPTPGEMLDMEWIMAAGTELCLRSSSWYLLWNWRE